MLLDECRDVVAMALEYCCGDDMSPPEGEEDSEETGGGAAQEDLDAMLALSHMCAQSRDLVSRLCTRLSVYHFLRDSTRALSAVFERGRNVLIQGPAGVGKTTLTNRILRHARDSLGLTTYILAPTQAAAELLEGGQTIHSFLHIRKTEPLERLEEKYAKFEEMRRFSTLFRPKEAFPDLIVIDEVSMVGDSLLENLDFILRRRKEGKMNVIFGGVQVVCVGDFCQLPPVGAKKAFEWPKWRDFKFVKILLERPLRQAQDRAWFNYLQRVRCGGVRYYSSLDGGPATISDADYERLMSSKVEAVDKPVILSAENKAVEEMNNAEFDRIQAPVERVMEARDILLRRNAQPSGRYTWTALDDVPEVGDLEKIAKCYRLQQQVRLKVGARYIITYNIAKSRGIYNGQSCVYLGHGTFEYRRQSDGGLVSLVDISNLMAQHTVQTGREPNLYIARTQIALRLGYAQTIHKSQGLTLRKAILDLRKIRCPGQYYVACSRVRSRADILVRNPTTSKLQVSGAVLAYVFGADGNDDEEEEA